jgi:hypothetical protein
MATAESQAIRIAEATAARQAALDGIHAELDRLRGGVGGAAAARPDGPAPRLHSVLDLSHRNLVFTTDQLAAIAEAIVGDAGELGEVLGRLRAIPTPAPEASGPPVD